MKISLVLRSAARVVIVLAAFPAVTQAHPGHDGHELTWDLGHLAAHPFATLLWAVLISGGVWGLARLASFSAEAMRVAAVRRKIRR